MRGGVLAAIGVAVAGFSISATAAVGPSLGAARTFAVLGGSTVTNTGVTTAIVGDLGVSPGSAITGFAPEQISGGTYVGGDAPADAAHADASLAYAFLAGMASNVNLTSVDLGGMTLAPGVYTFNTSAGLTGDLVLDAGGDSAAVFVFQIGSTLTTASGATVTVINGGADYDESNVFWQVGSSATLGLGTAFVGNIIADQSITLNTGTSVLGNILAINGAAALDSNAVTSPRIIVVPAAPIGLTAVVVGEPSSPGADLSWDDASTNEDEFRVYRRDGAGPAFALIGTVATTDKAGIGAAFTFQDPALDFESTYTYRVTAFSTTDGVSVSSNEALLQTGNAVPPVLAPINLTAVLTGDEANPGSDLDWTDVSDNETEFRVYRRDGAEPDFVLVATIATTDMPGINGAVTYQDLILDPTMTYTYRVTAFNLADGESFPSNEALVGTGIAPPVRWVDVELGRRRSLIQDRARVNGDRVHVSGSYTIIEVYDGVPTVAHNMNPKLVGCSMQVRAPGNMILLTIPANDAGWKVSKSGIYRWKSPKSKTGPISTLRYDTKKSEFVFTSKRIQFGAIPVNAITVSMTCEGATGSDVSDWNKIKTGKGSKALFMTSK